jgi:hypothetical protein
MWKLSVISWICILCLPAKEKKYLIVAGDITCKACVIELHGYLEKRTKKNNLSIAFRNKGNIILNESGLNYFRKELPKANFIFLDNMSFFPDKERYPYLLSISKNDTLKIPYDSLFFENGLNTKHLR